MDTDAAGIWHHTALVRWAEEAEAELHRRAGIIEQTFGVTPRVHVEFDFSGSLRFDEMVRLTLTVAELGHTSITYRIDLMRDQDLIATGSIVAVFIDRETGKKQPWTEVMRSALEGGVAERPVSMGGPP